MFFGELGLDGRLRPVRGVLPAVAAAAEAGFGTVMVAEQNASEAALVPGVRVIAAGSLIAAVGREENAAKDRHATTIFIVI